MHRDTDPTVPIPHKKPTVDELRTLTLEALRKLAPLDTPSTLNTEQLADLLHVKPATVRRANSQAGHYNGLIPLKVGRRLLWKIR